MLEAIGGFGGVRNLLAEDQAIGIRVRKAGYAIRLSHHVIDNVNQARSFRWFLNRHSRWFKIRRRLAPVTFLAEPLANLGTIGLVWALSDESGVAWGGLLVLVGLGMLRDAVQTRWLRGSFPRLRHLLLSPVKDLFLLPVWFDALVNRRVDWRGNRFLVGRSPGSALPGSRGPSAAASAGSPAPLPAPPGSGVAAPCGVRSTPIHLAGEDAGVFHTDPASWRRCSAWPSACSPARPRTTAPRRHPGQDPRFGPVRLRQRQGGGAPYIYPDPSSPRDVTGFEVELMQRWSASSSAPRRSSPRASGTSCSRCSRSAGSTWSSTATSGPRAARATTSRPVPTTSTSSRSWPRGTGRSVPGTTCSSPGPGGRRWRVGVLTSSAADSFAREQAGRRVEVVSFDGTTDAHDGRAQRPGRRHAPGLARRALLPRSLSHASSWPARRSGTATTSSSSARATRPLRDALDRALEQLIASGTLRRLYEKYGIWNDAQHELTGWTGEPFRVPAAGAGPAGGSLWQYAPLLLDAALLTIVLSVASMPLAMLIGLFVALGRLYGPRSLKVVLTGYVELLRGTPLMLQLFVLFYLLRLPALVAAIAGLAINYSAYEAEIYRAGLQAIPAGQMEAALALGMSRRLALRRVIVPQAVRIVIPPVTNDFIALFKDTSVCSVITLVELTKQYSILGNSTGGWLEFALATAVLYMGMSVPLSWFSRWSERRLEVGRPEGRGRWHDRGPRPGQAVRSGRRSSAASRWPLPGARWRRSSAPRAAARARSCAA